ncbi:MAG: metallophosphoesterase [Elusimicrobiota bacterium]
MYSIFIADLHLSISGPPEKYRSFIDFLEFIKKDCSNLYILGDLFSYWYEHKKIDFYSDNPVLNAIGDFVQNGKKAYFIVGNRDFAAGKFFKQYSKVEYIGETLDIQTGSGKKIFLTHGDMFAKKDIRYAIWKKFIRSPFASFAFKKLPVGFAIKVVEMFTRVGQSRPERKKAIAEDMLDFAVPYFSKGYDAIVAGHAHFEIDRKIGIDGREKEFHILSEFEFPGKFLILNDSGLEYINLG